MASLYLLLALVGFLPSCGSTDAVTTDIPADPGPGPGSQPPPPPEGGVLFRSDWSTATGDSDAATSDGGTWDALVCPDFARRPVLSVVTGSTVGWSATPNVMRVTNRGSQNCGQAETRDDIPMNQDYYVRMYIRVENESQINFHPVAINCCGDIQTALWAIFSPQATVNYDAAFQLESNRGNPYNRWRPRNKLAQRQWYRFEWFVDFVSGLQARIWPRVYDLQGNLLYDASSFVTVDDGGQTTLQAFYDSGGRHVFTSADLARRFAVGYEGNAMARDNGASWYYAAVEIRSDAWPGPLR